MTLGLPELFTVISTDHSAWVASTIAGSSGQRGHETMTPLTAEEEPPGTELECC